MIRHHCITKYSYLPLAKMSVNRSGSHFETIAIAFLFFFTKSFHEFVFENFHGFKFGYLIYVVNHFKFRSICQTIEQERSKIESNAVRSNMSILLDFYTFSFTLFSWLHIIKIHKIELNAFKILVCLNAQRSNRFVNAAVQFFDILSGSSNR